MPKLTSDDAAEQFLTLDHEISEEVRLLPSIGHTPSQLPHPDLSPAFDSGPVEAAEPRAQVFGEWADGEVLAIGTHYAGPTEGRVRREGGAFSFEV